MGMSKKNIIQALTEAKGIISVAARSLDCSRQAIYKRLNKDEDIKEAREQARNGMIDEAENALHSLITNPDHKDHYKAVRYYLSTQGKDRGYSERIENDVRVKELPTLQVEVTRPDEAES